MDTYEFYKQYHQNPINRAIHAVFIPCIVLTTMILLQNININLVSYMLPIYCLYYYSWGWKIGLYMTIYFVVLDTIGVLLNKHYKPRMELLVYTLILFTVSWIMQFIGHYIEGRRPALMDSLTQAFLGAPLFSIDFLIL